MTPPEPDPGRDDVTGFMLRSYADSGHLSFTAPPADVIVRRARRRTTTKLALSFAAVVAVAAGSIAAITGLGPDPDRDPPIIGPTPTPSVSLSPTPSPPPTPATTPPSTPPDPSGRSRPASPDNTPSGTGSAPTPVSVRGVDWANATITMTASTGDECLTGRIRFVDGRGGRPGDDAPHIMIAPSYYDERAATFGDLNGDGRDEAVVHGSCLSGPGDEDGSGQVLVVTGRSGQLVGSWVGPVAEVVNDVEVTGERLVISSTKKYAEPEVPVDRTYRWTGTRYVQS
ncbi:hypothetical protein LADH09A_005762 [Micromonospora sp. LAH09]|uniref:hypothetical protein n=1 Tax=Micromonospora cabrerizensis TaxID=2911213 RepID=UPI001EE9ACAB|nr:hypothetical protein [Micromonospora cabrerizensis]MCG5471760.1 hypothetical protein [Micromonospora cabrerizensis]